MKLKITRRQAALAAAGLLVTPPARKQGTVAEVFSYWRPIRQSYLSEGTFHFVPHDDNLEDQEQDVPILTDDGRIRSAPGFALSLNEITFRGIYGEWVGINKWRGLLSTRRNSDGAYVRHAGVRNLGAPATEIFAERGWQGDAGP